ncbi:mitochondrial DNA replication protein [Aspergillus steynii IBT 23096]|uniref:Mitochondrial DNA replication protein n=1 Tax=Aspergillus steynii IBT 23096 TaxID=1392250 RepID=A0A2I2GF52_9EURO|nr:mitochondrial DNA replication protein [Aspergillus steynii IBT 23096]PLB51457.1 mitochondrial DNA replication protein [Aspergillus steynii IBT 23096]
MALQATSAAQSTRATATDAQERRSIPFRNLAVGAFMNLFQVTSLGQPMEVLKTHLAANRHDTLKDAFSKTWARGGISAYYQGLIPWAWLEASTKGAILILTSSEIEYHARTNLNASPTTCGILGGIGGGIAQSYLTMGMTTCMKTVEVTRSKLSGQAAKVPGAMETFFNILREKGIRGVNKGVNAVALRQVTGWSSRIGIARFAEEGIRSVTGRREERLKVGEKILASTIGGALSCWNQPFEVLRVEMQSMKNDPTRPKSATMISTLQHIVRTSGVKGLFRGVVPRIGVAAWATVCMVGFGDTLKEMVQKR